MWRVWIILCSEKSPILGSCLRPHTWKKPSKCRTCGLRFTYSRIVVLHMEGRKGQYDNTAVDLYNNYLYGTKE